MKGVRLSFSVFIMAATMVFSCITRIGILPVNSRIYDGYRGVEVLESGSGLSYYAMYINEDGSFFLFDDEAGNPGVEGEIWYISNDTILIVFDKEEEFDPPTDWKGVKTVCKFKYEFVGDELHLIYKKGDYTATCVFVELLGD